MDRMILLDGRISRLGQTGLGWSGQRSGATHQRHSLQVQRLQHPAPVVAVPGYMCLLGSTTRCGGCN